MRRSTPNPSQLPENTSNQSTQEMNYSQFKMLPQNPNFNHLIEPENLREASFGLDCPAFEPQNFRMSQLSEEEASAIFESRKKTLFDNLMTQLKRSHSNSSLRSCNSMQNKSSTSLQADVSKKRMSLQVHSSSNKSIFEITSASTTRSNPKIVHPRKDEQQQQQQQLPLQKKPSSQQVQRSGSAGNILIHSKPTMKDNPEFGLADLLSFRTVSSSTTATSSQLRLNRKSSFSSCSINVPSSSTSAAGTGTASSKRFCIDLKQARVVQSPDQNERSYLKPKQQLDSNKYQKSSQVKSNPQVKKPTITIQAQQKLALELSSLTPSNSKSRNDSVNSYREIRKRKQSPMKEHKNVSINSSISPASGIQSTAKTSAYETQTRITKELLKNNQKPTQQTSNVRTSSSDNLAIIKQKAQAIIQREMDRQQQQQQQQQQHLSYQQQQQIPKTYNFSQQDDLTRDIIKHLQHIPPSQQQSYTLTSNSHRNNEAQEAVEEVASSSPQAKQKRIQFSNILATNNSAHFTEKTPLKSILVNRKSSLSNERNNITSSATVEEQGFQQQQQQQQQREREELKKQPFIPESRLFQNFSQFKVYFDKTDSILPSSSRTSHLQLVSNPSDNYKPISASSINPKPTQQSHNLNCEIFDFRPKSAMSTRNRQSQFQEQFGNKVLCQSQVSDHINQNINSNNQQHQNNNKNISSSSNTNIYPKFSHFPPRIPSAQLTATAVATPPLQSFSNQYHSVQLKSLVDPFSGQSDSQQNSQCSQQQQQQQSSYPIQQNRRSSLITDRIPFTPSQNSTQSSSQKISSLFSANQPIDATTKQTIQLKIAQTHSQLLSQTNRLQY